MFQTPYKIAPSILSADFAKLGEQVALVEKGGADWIHVDVMDGHFVPNLTIGPVVVQWIRPCTQLPLDVHLMIDHPEKYVEAFAKAGSDSITVHIEACPDFPGVAALIRKQGKRAGVSLRPKTPLSAIEPHLGLVDLVLIMTVEPGFGGQSFMQEMMPKVKALSDQVKARNLKLDIEVDGGIGPKTISTVAEAGARVFVAGSAIFSTPDPAAAVGRLRESIVVR